jgi:hypothetical protein
MNNDVQTDAPCRLFQFEGELRPDLVEALYALMGAEPAACALIDCRRVTSYASGALDALLALERRVAAGGGKAILLGVEPPELFGEPA